MRLSRRMPSPISQAVANSGDEIRRSRKRALFVRPRLGVLSVIGISRQQCAGHWAAQLKRRPVAGPDPMRV